MVLISSKFITFLPKKHSYNSTIEIKSKTGTRDPQIATLPFNRLRYTESYHNIVQI